MKNYIIDTSHSLSSEPKVLVEKSDSTMQYGDDYCRLKSKQFSMIYWWLLYTSHKEDICYEMVAITMTCYLNIFTYNGDLEWFTFLKLLFGWRVVSMALTPHLPISIICITNDHFREHIYLEKKEPGSNLYHSLQLYRFFFWRNELTKRKRIRRYEIDNLKSWIEKGDHIVTKEKND